MGDGTEPSAVADFAAGWSDLAARRAPEEYQPDPWPGLLATVERGLVAPPTMDVRVATAQRAIRDRVLAAIRARAAEVGPVVPPSFPDAAIDLLLAAHVEVERATPAGRKALAPLVNQALDLAVKLAMMSAPKGGGGEAA